MPVSIKMETVLSSRAALEANLTGRCKRFKRFIASEELSGIFFYSRSALIGFVAAAPFARKANILRQFYTRQLASIIPLARFLFPFQQPVGSVRDKGNRASRTGAAACGVQPARAQSETPSQAASRRTNGRQVGGRGTGGGDGAGDRGGGPSTSRDEDLALVRSCRERRVASGGPAVSTEKAAFTSIGLAPLAVLGHRRSAVLPSTSSFRAIHSHHVLLI